MENKELKISYQDSDRSVSDFIYNTLENLYNAISPRDYFDGSKKIASVKSLEGRSKEVGFEIIDTRKKKD